ncbi:thiamine-phosphate kinase [Nevskia sp.]|uniref:thiamine-phosphate kinase n=1 Tax=Nevskia sp. TaxID=1929292 RepID=UPI0025F8C73D|nr:thiamine-phosphate kinase [Nevskia sp.]
MDEFSLIRRYFAGLTEHAPGVRLGIGDDAAILIPPPGHELLMTSDTLVAGRHFPLHTVAYDIGWKALAVNLSDLAAMGAAPLWFLLALTLPSPDERWLAGFADGLRELSEQHGIALVGGDTTRGPLSITITAVGSAPAGTALRREGAKVGDVVCVTGTLGDAALALSGRAPALQQRLDRPTPRIDAGLALRGIATAAIDLSDGLAGDLGHVLAASGMGAELDAETLPMSEAFALATESAERLTLQAARGDDYELCVCLPSSRLREARAAVEATGTTLTAIGVISAEPGLRWTRGGLPIDGPQHGYRHFDDGSAAHG